MKSKEHAVLSRMRGLRWTSVSVLAVIAVLSFVLCGCDGPSSKPRGVVDRAPAQQQYSDGTTVATWLQNGTVRYSFLRPGMDGPVKNGGGWSDYQSWHMYYDVKTGNLWVDSEMGLYVLYLNKDGHYSGYDYDIYDQGEVLPDGVPRSAPDAFVRYLSDLTKRGLRGALERAPEKLDNADGSQSP